MANKVCLGIHLKDCKVVVFLFNDKKIISKINFSGKRREAEYLLPTIARILSRGKYRQKDLRGVAVYAGPGSFSSLRILVSMANTLAWSLGIPVVGVRGREIREINALQDFVKAGIKKLKKQKKFKLQLPYYGKQPNITYPKQLVIN